MSTLAQIWGTGSSGPSVIAVLPNGLAGVVLLSDTPAGARSS